MSGHGRKAFLTVFSIAALLAVAAAITGCSAAPGGHTYYAATWGSDGNDGTSKDTAFKSVQYAIDRHLSGGDTLIVYGGTYHERLNFDGRDYKGLVTVRAATEAEGGTGPVILDGSRQPGEAYENYFNADKDIVKHDIQLEMIRISDSSNIRIEGFDICNNNVPHGGWNAVMGILVEATADGGCHNIQIVNNKVHDIDGETWGYRAYVEDDEEFVCDMNGHGIAVYGEGFNKDNAITDVLIQGNEVFDCKLGQSESVVVNGNVDGFKILQNYVHDNDNIGIDAIGGESTSGDWDDYSDEPIDSGWDYARNGTIAGNAVINCSANSNQTYGDDGGGCDGIYIDGARDVLIENNYVIASDYCIEIGTERNGGYDLPVANGITVRNNIVSYGAYGGILVGGTYGARDNTIENNTVFAPVIRNLTEQAEPYSIEKPEPGGDAANNVFTKNIFAFANSADGKSACVFRNEDGYSFKDNVYWGNTYDYGNPKDAKAKCPDLCPFSPGDGAFTISGDFNGYGADTDELKNAMGEGLFNIAKNNYAARRAALPDFAAAFNAINGEKDRSIGEPLTMSQIGDNLCRYFESLPGVPAGTVVGMKHMGSVSRYAGGQAIDGIEDGIAKYYGYVQIGREADGQIMFDKIAAGGPRLIKNIVLYFKTPYESDGRTSYIVKQIGSNITSGSPTEEGSVCVDFSAE